MKLVRQRDRDGKDMQQAGVIKERDGNVETGARRDGKIERVL